MSARRQIVAALSEDSYGGIATLSDVDHAEQLVDAVVAEAVAAALNQAADEIEKAQARLVAKKTVVNLLRRRANTAAEKATAPETATATPSAADRQAALLDAIHAHGGRWKSGRAVQALRTLGIHPVSPGTAASDLNRLAEAGHLDRHDKPGVTFYTLRKDNQ